MIPGSANPLLLASAADDGYAIERSLRFNSADSAYLSRTPASSGNRKTWTWAGWVKKVAIGQDNTVFSANRTSNFDCAIRFLSTNPDKLEVFQFEGTVPFIVATAAVFRDPSAWYHIAVAFDTTRATSTDRIKVYVNGVPQVLTGTFPSLNFDADVNAAVPHAIGRWQGGAARYFSGYLADIHFIDGQALDPTSFGEFSATTGVWVPKAYTGSYGTNGFHLEFADNSSNTATTLGKDTSGNGNNWTPNNLSITAGAGNDSLVDVPTNGAQTDTGAGGEVRGNYCTLNPLDNGGLTLANGNLDASRATASWVSCRATIGMASGKWYWEVSGTGTYTSSNGPLVGISKSSATLASYPGNDANGWGYYSANGNKYTGAVAASYGSVWTGSDVIGIAFDADNGTLTFYKNNVSQGTAFTGLTSGPYFPATGIFGTATSYINFGQRPFAYTAPSGFKALNTANLPAPLVTKPSTVFDVALDTGANILTAAQNKLTTGTDLLWIKDRANTNNHQLIDTVRGGTATLQSNTTAAETTYSAPSGSSVAWCWDAGSSTVTNTSGSISSQVRANASAGFSVVTYTGTGANASVGHGLGVAPSLIIIKARTQATARHWAVYHASVGATKILELSTTNAAQTVNFWQDTAPTSTVFTLSNQGDVNASTYTYVAYCFAPVAGYSSFGSYTGNGSADGPFVYTGFRPAFVLVKMSSSTGNWTILDSKRLGYNVDNRPLFPNLSNAEGTTVLSDITSNGFKVRTTDATFNTNAGTYVFAAWAESPFQYSRAR